MTRKIVTVAGARPQFVKAAVVSRVFTQRGSVCEVFVHTGQHFDANMSDVFFSELGIRVPDYHLGIGGGTHGGNTGRMLMEIERVLLEERPDFLLVYGDTDSTLAGALAAVKLCIPVVHVEAGLRSFNRRMPEEINRILTDHASDLLFAPTCVAADNLSQEGIAGDKVFQVGDVMFDAMLHYSRQGRCDEEVLCELSVGAQRYVLATIHRQENTDDALRLAAIFSGLASSPLPVILPLHPRTRRRLDEHNIAVPAAVKVIDPLGYLDMVVLERNAALIATDSGGVQKEAYFHRIPCLTLRDETEWVELVAAGANILVGADTDRIAAALAAPPSFPTVTFDIYGDGHAGEKIAAILLG